MTTELGAKIRAARLARGWSQTELAQQLGSTKKSVGIWERTGVISPLSLGRLAKVLDLDADGHWLEEMAQETYQQAVGPAQRAVDAVYTPAKRAADGYERDGRSYRHLSMTVQIPEDPHSLLATLQRLRRDLTRMSAELDKALETLEAQSK